MSEDPNFSMEWHKGFQIGLYSGISKERERIIKLLHQELADGFAKAFVIGLIIGEPFPHVRTDAEEKTDE